MTDILELAAAHKALATALEKVHAAEQRLIKASAPAEEPTPESTSAALKYPVGTRVRILDATVPRQHAFAGRTGRVKRALAYTRSYSVAVDVDGAGVVPFHNDEIEAIPEEPTLWGYKVGDLVRYALPHEDAILGLRVVGAIESEPTRLRLDVPGGSVGVGRVHSPDRIRLAV